VETRSGDELRSVVALTPAEVDAPVRAAR
jgi:hypothetical protein